MSSDRADGAKSLAQTLGSFAADARLNEIPPEVRRRACLLMLDAIGVALAATRFDFAARGLAALRALGRGESDLIGMSEKLPLRDAITLNATLVHGLDYDDTYLPGSVHLTASCVPTVLGVAASVRATGEELLLALVIGLESAARVGAGARGGFLRAGFHATSVCGIFGCTLAAGRLMQLDAEAIANAQGIALSMASGNMQPMQDGAWTKRLHPGLAGASAVTAVAFAKEGYVGPREPYEGRFGLYPCFLGTHAADADYSIVRAGLGEQWEFTRSSIKLFPACHQSHAFFNAAIALTRDETIEIKNIESILARAAEPAVPLVLEPLTSKRRPQSSYAAQFSLPYGLAACLSRSRFTLNELEPESFNNPELVALAHKVDYEIDPNAGYPKTRSGEVVIRMKNGKTLWRREDIAPDDIASEEAIIRKFMNNAASVVSVERATSIRDCVLNVHAIGDAREFTRLIAT